MKDQAHASVFSFSRWMTLPRVVAIGIPVIGAIPTATNIYYGWKYDIPWWDVQHRVEQARLWEKNGECKIEYRALSTGKNTVVYVGSCRATGDVSLKVSAAGRDPIYEWIAFKSLRKPGENRSFWNQLIPTAGAAAGTAAGSRKTVQLAQATSQVVCQSKQGKKIVRIIREGNRCVRETFSPFKGRVEKREEVPCDATCPAPAER